MLKYLILIILMWCMLCVKSDDLTCFTCAQSLNNEECNKQAIDEPCRALTPNSTNDKYICMTVNKMNMNDLKSISVEKKCVIECNRAEIGCKLDETNENVQIKTCKYCCDDNYCNFNSTIDTEQSILYSKSFIQSTNSCQRIYYSKILLIISFIFKVRI
ncbi:unnamed protein product [Brachionus calyciflorus]|uniref:Uncharacterized protein n=1 Tax=Brachionus calyciflorus TaxID=104777 RepID=A0A814JAT2_9BILA|nr:unnamed protein product [Brachionus calyciflorus]